uniref:Transposase Tc1-like domain-containing protein n=1 Tax=Oncorhynchus mykiss TaxID=8022 RepID=A0A8K9UD77_ONCMY
MGANIPQKHFFRNVSALPVTAHLCERALGMLQGGMRTADVVKAINCNVRTVRCLRQHYRETGRTADRSRSGRPHVTTPAQDRYIRTSHLRDRYRMATTTARVTPGTHNPSISAQTVCNGLREAGLRACRPVVRQVLTRHHRVTPRPVLWSGIDMEVQGTLWSEAMYHSIIGLSLLSLQAISMLCVTRKTSSSLRWYPSCRLILT